MHRFIVAESKRCSVASTKCVVSGLRSLLRFSHLERITYISLAGAVPTVAGWTGTWPPRGVVRESVRRLLASCDRACPQGRRDFGVLTVLKRLGLRVGEVAALELGDVDWFNGELLVRGKAHRVGVTRCHPTLVRLWPTTCGWPALGRGPSAVPAGPRPAPGVSRAALIVAVRSACDRTGLAPVAVQRLRPAWSATCYKPAPGCPRSASSCGTAAWQHCHRCQSRHCWPTTAGWTLAWRAVMSDLRRAAGSTSPSVEPSASSWAMQSGCSPTSLLSQNQKVPAASAPTSR